MTNLYHNFISSILAENYATANKYLRKLVEGKIKKKIAIGGKKAKAYKF